MRDNACVNDTHVHISEMSYGRRTICHGEMGTDQLQAMGYGTFQIRINEAGFRVVDQPEEQAWPDSGAQVNDHSYGHG